MSGATSYAGARRAPGALPFAPRRIRLDGWAKSPHWKLAHYLVDGGSLCAIGTTRNGLELLGSLKGRRCCGRCLEALGRGEQ